jgi:glycerol-3-phosphate dehydrogenase
VANAYYDVVVIGGGIHGVGVAQAAAASGYSVVVLEQGQLASGTSSRSSKLIHGGLRYLEHGQLGLVRECLYERNLLLKLAPDLVKLRPFYIPVYQQSKRNRFTIRAGLSLYALLGGALLGNKSAARFKSLSAKHWDSLDGLQTQNLRAVFQYHDAQTDDKALTCAVMASAQNLGAELLLNTEFLGAHLGERGDVGGGNGDDNSEVRFKEGGVEKSCRCRVIVNAGGPWVNSVLERVDSGVSQLAIDLVQGAHILLRGKLERGVYYLESPQDQRPLFATPWRSSGQDVVMVGTTETNFTGDPKNVRPLPQEQQYLQEAFDHYFPNVQKEGANARRIDAFAGLRVLPTGNGSPGDFHAARSRDTILFPDRPEKPRLVTIYGGKLTAYRATAEKVMALLQASLPQQEPVADTRKLPLFPI